MYLSHYEHVTDQFHAAMADRVASGVHDGVYNRAILVCGTGTDICISANKVGGIRAALTHDIHSAQRAALSTDAQIITIGARISGSELAKTIADTFLQNTGYFDLAGPSASNVRAIDGVEEKYAGVDGSEVVGRD